MYCNQCGKDLSESPRFCRHCGATISVVANSAAATSQQVVHGQELHSTETRVMPSRNRWLMVSIFCLVAIALAAIFLRPSNEVQEPTFSVGDQWVSRIHVPGGKSLIVVKSVTSIDHGAVKVLEQDPIMTHEYRIDGRNPDQNSSWRAPHFPLKTGKSWVRVAGNVTRTLKVGDWSEVTVPAGTFRALSISEELIIGTNGPILSTSWYAPDVKDFVMTRGSDGTVVSELVSYSLK